MPESIPHRQAALERTTTAVAIWAAPRLHGPQAEAVHRRIAEGAREVERRQALPLTIAYPAELPVSGQREAVLNALRGRRVLVLTGETGSGKTTQLPKMLLEAGYGRRGMIAHTQPRRVAAVSIARRLAEELRAPSGVVVHAVRFDDRSTPDTLVRVCTDGLLLAEAGRDRDLARYDAVIVDEAHERSLDIDVLLGLLRGLRRRRPDLAVVVTSATLDAAAIAAYLGDDRGPAPVLAVGGRTWPVEIVHRPPADEDLGFLAACVQTVEEIHRGGETGDILCFLPTERDILEARRRLDREPGLVAVPLFGRLNPQEQQAVFAPVRGRKVVLATNIAETSLTVPGIRFVVDTGLARIKRYAADRRTERLPIEAVAQASLIQRAGRAGRVGPGVCIRLFAAEDELARSPYTEPEIRRSNLAGVLVRLLAARLGDGEDFPWLDAPSVGAWAQARTLLDELGALEADPRPGRRGRLTRLGRDLAALPADPQIGRILLAGVDEGCAHEACTLAAFLSVQEPRLRPIGKEAEADRAHAAFHHEAGDLATVLKLHDAWAAQASNGARSRFCEQHLLGWRRMREWDDVRHQFWQALRTSLAGRHLPPAAHPPDRRPLDAIHRAVLSGMLGNVCRRDDERRCWRAAGNREVHLHPGSALRRGPDGAERKGLPEWLVACEAVETSRAFIRLCAPISPEWVIRLAGPRVKRTHRDARFDPERGRVVCDERVSWKGLPLVEARTIAYERVDAVAAQDIFLRDGLAAGAVRSDLPALRHNRQVLDDLATLRDRLRDPTLVVDEAVLVDRLRRAVAGSPRPISSVAGLLAWVRERGDAALRLAREDLLPADTVARADRGFPTQVDWSGRPWTLRWRYRPGDSDDGATLEVAEADLGRLDRAWLDRAAPGLAEEAVPELLQRLPKDLRRRLIPLAESVRRLAPGILAAAAPLAEAVAEVVGRDLGTPCPVPETADLPDHLRLRLVVRSPSGRILYDGRDLDEALALVGLREGADPLAGLRARWRTVPGRDWPGDLPERVDLGGRSGCCGLLRDRGPDAGVAVRREVFATAAAAAAWHADGVEALLEARLGEALDRLATAPAPAGWERDLGTAVGPLRRALALAAIEPAEAVRSAEDFAACEERARAVMAGLPPRVDALLAEVAEQVRALRSRLRKGSRNLAGAAALAAVQADVDRLLAPGWPRRTTWEAVQRLPRQIEVARLRLDQAEVAPQAAQRAQEARDRVLAQWDDTFRHLDARLLTALGLRPVVRKAAGLLEDCLLAQAAPDVARRIGVPVAGSEGRLNQALAEVDERVGGFEHLLRGARRELVELEPYLRPATDRPALLRLRDRVAACLRHLPDLSHGCDLDAQLAEARDLVVRARAALRG